MPLFSDWGSAIRTIFVVLYGSLYALDKAFKWNLLNP